MPDPEFDRDELRRAAPEYTEASKNSLMLSRYLIGPLALAAILFIAFLPVILQDPNPNWEKTSPFQDYPYTFRWKSSFSITDRDSFYSKWKLGPSELAYSINKQLASEKLKFTTISLVEEPSSSSYYSVLFINQDEEIPLEALIYTQQKGTEWTSNEEWAEGYIYRITLTLFQGTPSAQTDNEQYVRSLADILNPGSDDFVIESLDLSSTSEDVRKVWVSTTLYSYNPKSQEITICPQSTLES